MVPELTYDSVNRDVLRTLERPKPFYFLAVGFTALLFLMGVWAEAQNVKYGLGMSGYMHPVYWAFYITDFVFWVGIGHAGTLISAILYLFRARWRMSVYRAAEAMTVFAVMTAGLFPLLHVGRPWYSYWLVPYPNQRQLWVNFKSPLIWDVFAVSTYMTVSITFLIIGLLPDIAAARDKAVGIRKIIYSVTSLGWTGSSEQWRHYTKAYMFFAALATPLVLSVHSVVSWDFAMSIVPGWHSTLFPPYFVAGAILSGVAMVITILIPLRKLMGLEHIITMWHFEALAKLLLLTSTIVGYAYATEFFMAWYSGAQYEIAHFKYRAFGDYAFWFWFGMVFCNSLFPQLFYFKKVRTNLWWLFVITIFVNIGMWLERFIIIVTALAHEYDPYSWGVYKPSHIDWMVTIGSFGWFFTLFLLFSKFFPIVSINEVKEILRPPMKEAKH
jgi:molybdopterin-containing oxidoreductase family membrane subunit